MLYLVSLLYNYFFILIKSYDRSIQFNCYTGFCSFLKQLAAYHKTPDFCPVFFRSEGLMYLLKKLASRFFILVKNG